MKALHGFLQTTRFFKSLGVAALLGLVSGSWTYGMGTLLFLTFSFAFNDWTDASKDILGHPHRAIPSGKLTNRQSFYISLSLLSVGFFWSFQFLYEHFLGFSIIYLLSTIYSFILKINIPIVATPVWATAIAILFLQPFSNDLVTYIAVALVVYAYELLLDYRDSEADKKFCYQDP